MGRLVTVSLFSGCGGSDMGARRAGADIVLANDIDHDATATYVKYKDLLAVPDAKVICGDVADIKRLPKCDLLLGCYPCQSFSMGGPRRPHQYEESRLFMEFKRCLGQTRAKFFVAENVAGLAWLDGGRHLREQIEAFEHTGPGYVVSPELLNVKDYGVPEDRKRIIIVGVRSDVGAKYEFPKPTHGPPGSGLKRWTSHGQVLTTLPMDAAGEFYDRLNEPFSWWYMSRNRKRPWSAPSYAIQGNGRHVPLHPASPKMRLVESRLNDGWKQVWEFTDEYDVPDGRDRIERPRRMSWRECAAVQGFPLGFEPVGNLMSKYKQIGNAVPPKLMESVIRAITDGTGLQAVSS